MSQNNRKFKKYWAVAGIFLLTSQLGLANDLAKAMSNCVKNNGSWFQFSNNTLRNIEVRYTYPDYRRHFYTYNPAEKNIYTLGSGDSSTATCCKRGTKIYLKYSCYNPNGKHPSSTQVVDCDSDMGYGRHGLLMTYSGGENAIPRGATMGCPDLNILFSELTFWRPSR